MYSDKLKDNFWIELNFNYFRFSRSERISAGHHIVCKRESFALECWCMGLSLLLVFTYGIWLNNLNPKADKAAYQITSEILCKITPNFLHRVINTKLLEDVVTELSVFIHELQFYFVKQCKNSEINISSYLLLLLLLCDVPFCYFRWISMCHFHDTESTIYKWKMCSEFMQLAKIMA